MSACDAQALATRFLGALPIGANILMLGFAWHRPRACVVRRVDACD